MKDCCEHYKCYDQIFINDYHEFKYYPLPQQYIPNLLAKEKDGILSNVAQAGSEKSVGRLSRQLNRSHVDSDPKSSNGKNRDIVQELTEHQLLLLHPETLVYGLKLKQ